MRADMRLRDLSLRQDPDLRQELASLARGCDFVLPSRFKKRLKAFQQLQVGQVCCVRLVCGSPELPLRPALGSGCWYPQVVTPRMDGGSAGTSGPPHVSPGTAVSWLWRARWPVWGVRETLP